MDSSAALLDHGHKALAACRPVLAAVSPADLERPTPCAEFTVADLVDHLTRSMALLAGSAGGQADAGDVATRAEAALAAWATRGLAGEAAVGRSNYPAPLAYAIVPLELVVHGWDLARAIGGDIDVPDDLAGYLLTQAQTLITPDKRGRGFAAEVTASPQATPLERLIVFTGR